MTLLHHLAYRHWTLTHSDKPWYIELCARRFSRHTHALYVIHPNWNGEPFVARVPDTMLYDLDELQPVLAIDDFLTLLARLDISM